MAGGLAVAALDGAAARAGGDGGAELSLRRGIGIYHMMQAPLRAGRDGVPVWPAFEGAPYDMPDAQIAALRRAGFDFVRLTLAPDVFIRASGADADALYATLQAKVRRFTHHGLAVVVTLMPGRAVAEFTDADFAEDGAGVFGALCAVVGRCAATLAEVAPGKVAIEPLNEPALFGPAALRWPQMQVRLHEAVRQVAPRMPVILTGAQGGGLEGLLDLDPRPYRGSDIFYSFHYYEPHLFTHQHASPRFRYLSGVSWPPRAEAIRAEVQRAEAAVAADSAPSPMGRAQAMATARKLLSEYHNSGSGPLKLAADFARVGAWADRHGIDRRRVLLGEFGVTRTLGGYAGAPEDDAAGWLKTVRMQAEQNGFGWALWAYSGPVTMTLANDYPARTLDHNLLRALGLRPAQTDSERGGQTP